MTAQSARMRANRRNLLKGAGAMFAGVTLLPRFSLADEEKKLSFFNYDTYIGEHTLADFNSATGIEVKMDLFADGDELFTKLKAGNPGYDVIVPPSNTLERMVKANMIMALDHAKIPNMSNIDKPFQDATFDPGRKYSIPYMWGTVGIGYRKSKVDGAVDSWKWVMDDAKYAGRIALLGDQEHTIGGALKYLGYGYNSLDPAELDKAKTLLISAKKYIKKYADDNGQDLLASGEVDLTMEYNGDIAQVMVEDDDLSYAVPTEGSNIWQDTVCIPNGAPHPENAHKFLNFILDAEAGKHIAETIQYATANAAAIALMDDKYKNNPAIFPPQEVLTKCEYATYLGEEGAKARDEIWTAIQAA